MSAQSQHDALAAAAASFLDVGPPPVFKIVVSAFVERDKMIIVNPTGTGADLANSVGVTDADLAANPGLKLMFVATADAAEKLRAMAQEVGLDLID